MARPITKKSVLSPVLLKRLVLVKHLYNRALIQIESANNFADKIVALITLDLAAETALKTVVADEPGANEWNFPNLISKVRAKISTVPDEANLRKVHKLRNNAQHDA